MLIIIQEEDCLVPITKPEEIHGVLMYPSVREAVRRADVVLYENNREDFWTVKSRYWRTGKTFFSVESALEHLAIVKSK